MEEGFSEDRLVKAIWDVVNPFRIGGLVTRAAKILGAGAVLAGIAAVFALPEAWSKGTAVALIVAIFAAGVSASYQHRKRLEELDSEKDRERREIQRCARAVLMEYDRIRQRETFWSVDFNLDSFQPLAKPLCLYRDAITSASYYSEAGLHGESCSMALAAIEVVSVPGVASGMLVEAMKKVRSLVP